MYKPSNKFGCSLESGSGGAMTSSSLCLHILLTTAVLAGVIRAKKVFVTKYNFTGFEAHETFYNGITFKNQQIDPPENFREMTYCFRINIEFFRYLGQYSFVLEMMDGGGFEGGRQVQKDMFRTMDFRIRDPIDNGNLFRLKTFLDEIVTARGQGNRNWHWPKLTNPVHIQEWNHFCIGYSANTRRVVMMHNGEVEVDHTRPAMVAKLDDHLPSEWLEPMLDGSKTKDDFLTRKGILFMKKQNIQGSFTDFNVWDTFLPLEEMKKFSLCQEDLAGSLLPWNGDDWEMTPEIPAEEYKIIDLDFSEICARSSKYLFLAERIMFPESVKVCQQFQGTMAYTDSDAEYRQVGEFLDHYGTPAPGVWLRFTDVFAEGVWVDYHSRVQPKFPIPWLILSEPTGFTGTLFIS